MKKEKKNLADVCGDGSGPIEGNNFEEDEFHFQVMLAESKFTLEFVELSDRNQI